MARRPEPPDDDDLPPSPRKDVKTPRTDDRSRAASSSDPDDDDDDEPPRKKPARDDDDTPVRTKSQRRAEEALEAEEHPPPSKPLTDLSDKALLKKLARYTEEYHILAGDASQAAVVRRVELTRLMRAVQTVRDAREPLVEVTVPRSVTGEAFKLGPKTFWPGLHVVRASEAQYLLWLIAENQRVEMNRLKQNGRTIDLGTIGSRARMARISRDDGEADYQGRGV